MADSADAIHGIAAYLGVKCGKVTYDGNEKIPVMKGKTGTRKGFSTIVKHLARAAENHKLIGVSAPEQAVVDQWLEYKTCQLDRCTTKNDLSPVLQDLNSYLIDKVYFLNHQLSIIDLALYYGLHNTLASLTFFEKQKYINLSRWFDNIQQDQSIRQSFQRVQFSKTKLYSGSAH
ncbi:eukaryotic translation elongation factor 1 epsilon-1-like [Dreissena polymorpha]|uniref:GST C-terminal domain-containing protein n=1 Tax=Dreissena polymorpha TaxID=45954 RepID=A0A9D4M2T9_DREPO|nr:eukaryotic translation elongation factor 1 epsilon-1-like [Dreissena polymorpha]XP_052268897.1 eukaryotic translation elongation factor 1 epsilon-1-like [Dreissena polymorpha]KAH3867416.1 hypothetical protein DPMN_030543 [Dreissena polymorpha]KAH3867486.1 hypothetical protein DPMN_030614 [Dreissena polymorpha]